MPENKILQNLKEGLKKSSWLNPLSHRIYYSWMRMQDQLRESGQVDQALWKVRQTKLYEQLSGRGEKSGAKKLQGRDREDETALMQEKIGASDTIWSFDIFDTLIRRRVLAPEGIFYYVQEKMQESEIAFPAHVMRRYPQLRAWCEANAREYYAKSLDQRKTQTREISFEMIFERMRVLYSLSEKQTDLLMKWELEGELANVLPCPKQIAMAESLIRRGERVCLISDMYLPEEFVRCLLSRVSEQLAKLPLFLSSSLGVQKSTGLLYDAAAKKMGFEPERGMKWIHYGDHEKADGQMAAEHGLRPVLHEVPAFGQYERAMTEYIRSYDSFLTAALIARERSRLGEGKDFYAAGYISLYFVPYISWVLRDAMADGIQTLYFISRDGYHLKQIADAMIRGQHLPLKTKYIYGSRRAWWIPSFIEDVDEEFFTTYANFSGVNTFPGLLKALSLTEEQFDRFFGELSEIKSMANLYRRKMEEIIPVLRENEAYRQFLLEKASRMRPLVEGYLTQEICFDEKHAFVEYWGRGYTQSCHARLLRDITGDGGQEVIYYYARSIYPSQGPDIRRNFTSCSTSLVFVEAIFANIPYKSIERYEEIDGRICPVLEEADCDRELHEAMNRRLGQFAAAYEALPVRDRDRLDRELYDFALQYYDSHKDTPEIASVYGTLIDAIGIHGKKREYAPVITEDMIRSIESGVSLGTLTTSAPMSKARSDEKMVRRFTFLTETVPRLREKNKLEAAEDGFEKDRFRREMETASERLKAWQKASVSRQKRYEALCKARPVKKQILLLTQRGDEDREELKRRIRETAPEGWSIAEVICGERNSASQLYEALAESAYVVIRKPLPPLSMIRLRPETSVILLPDPVLPLHMRRKDSSASGSGKAQIAGLPEEKHESFSQRKLREYLEASHASAVALPGEAAAEMMEALYAVSPSCAVIKGAPVTDLFFSEEYKKTAAEKMQQAFPTMGDRKCILCVLEGEQSAEFLNELAERADEWKERCVVAVWTKEDVYIPADCRGDMCCLTGKLTLREALVMAHVAAGNSVDAFREALLLDMPVFRIGSVDRPAFPVGSADRPAFPVGSADRPAFPAGSAGRSAFPASSSDRPAFSAGSADRPAFSAGFDTFLSLPEAGSGYELLDQLRKYEETGEYDRDGIKRLRDTWLGFCRGESAGELWKFIQGDR